VQVTRPADCSRQLDHVRRGTIDQPAIDLGKPEPVLKRQRNVRPIKLVIQASAYDLAVKQSAQKAANRRFWQTRSAVKILQAARAMDRQTVKNR